MNKILDTERGRGAKENINQPYKSTLKELAETNIYQKVI